MNLVEVLQGKRFGYPTHAIFVVFPAALFPVSLIFDISSYFAVNGRVFVEAAYYTMWGGVIGGVLAMFFGFIDFFKEVPRKTRAFKLATIHASLNIGVILIFISNVWLRRDVAGDTTPVSYLILSIVAVAALLVATTLGRLLVFRYAIRVEPVQNLLKSEERQKKTM